MAKKPEKKSKPRSTQKRSASKKTVKKPAKKATAKKTTSKKPAATRIKKPAKTSPKSSRTYDFELGGCGVFQFEDPSINSHKFWEISVNGTEVTTRWGRIGSKGQEKSFYFPSRDAAMADAIKRADKKIKEGYEEA